MRVVVSLFSMTCALTLLVLGTFLFMVRLPEPQSHAMVFTASLDGSHNLFHLGLDNGELRQLTATFPLDWSPDFGPIGKRIVFESGGSIGRNIYMMDLHTLQVTPSLTHSQASNMEPTWSPDGEWIVFVSNRANFTSNLFRLRADRRESASLRAEQLTRYVDAATAAPTWSPDGQYIAFTVSYLSDDGSRRADLYRLRVVDDALLQANLQPELVFTNGGFIRDPSWSPDGQWIAFSSELAGNSDIFRVEVNGSTVQQLTDSPSSERWPAWSPDGQWIAYARSAYIYRQSLRDQSTERLTSDLALSLYPSWAPIIDLRWQPLYSGIIGAALLGLGAIKQRFKN